MGQRGTRPGTGRAGPDAPACSGDQPAAVGPALRRWRASNRDDPCPRRATRGGETLTGPSRCPGPGAQADVLGCPQRNADVHSRTPVGGPSAAWRTALAGEVMDPRRSPRGVRAGQPFLVLDQVDRKPEVRSHHPIQMIGKPRWSVTDLAGADLEACPVQLPQWEVEQPSQFLNRHRPNWKLQAPQSRQAPGRRRQRLPNHLRHHLEEFFPGHSRRSAITAHRLLPSAQAAGQAKSPTLGGRKCHTASRRKSASSRISMVKLRRCSKIFPRMSPA
jgi:hypothetical protein